MNPRASAPRITSGARGPAQAARRSIVSRNATGSAIRGITSLNMIPSVGKSGTSRIRLARSSSLIALPPRAGRASAAAVPALARPPPGPRGLPAPRHGAPDCANGERERRPARAAPTGDPQRCEEAEVLQLAGELRRDAGAVAQLRHVDLLLLPAEAGGAALRAIGGRSAELLANHAQRQELVALQA